MRNEWKENLNNGWNPVLYLALNGEWILEIDKEKIFGTISRIGNLKAGTSITAFSGYYDFDYRHDRKFIKEIGNCTINADGLCEGIVIIEVYKICQMEYRFLVNLETGDRLVTKI